MSSKENNTLKSAVDAAVTAGSVKQFLLYSVFGAEYESILFGKQFRAGEKYLAPSLKRLIKAILLLRQRNRE